MSDQDFFFDEEDEKPARTQKSAAKSSSKSTGSTTAAARTASAKAAPAKAPEPSGEGFLFESMTVSKGIAVLVVVCALLLGLAAGILIGQSRAQTIAVSSVPAVSTGQTAPQLTQEQLNSGSLPAGHPSVGATSSSVATGQ